MTTRLVHRNQRLGRHLLNVALGVVFTLTLQTTTALTARAQSYSEHVLHRFTGFGNDGVNPAFTGHLVRDQNGNLYGATTDGGIWNAGTIFKLDASGRETILHEFAPVGNPLGDLVLDSQGNLYGDAADANGQDIIFKINPAGGHPRFKVLYTFTGGAEGSGISALLSDAQGAFYGATNNGGANGDGTIFKLDTTGHLTVLYNFTNNDGAYIYGLLRDAAGNFYGTSIVGGPYPNNCIQRFGGPIFGCGAVFKVNASGKEVFLHDFTGVNGDGGSPIGDLLMDAKGNVYASTLLGGTGTCQPPKSSTPGCGTVFKIDAIGKYSVVYSVPGNGTKGAGPAGGLAMDAEGNLYGATEAGGLNPGVCTNSGINQTWTGSPGCGTVFKLDAHGTGTVIHKFTGYADGRTPQGAGFIIDSAGTLYSTTWVGGDINGCGAGQGCGTVFKLSPKSR